MSKGEALFAVLIAFAVGVLAAGSLGRADHAISSPANGPGGSEAHAKGPILRWRVTSAFGTHLPSLGENPVDIAARLRAASGGRIDWTIDDPGEVVPAFSIVEAVSRGKIEAGYTWLGYDQGRLAASVLFGAVPFGMTPWEYSAWWVRGGGLELAREIYHPIGIEPILCGIIGPETAGWFRKEIVEPEDVEGLKIRFAGLGGRALQKLGAAVTMMPGGEIFQALEKGAIDATEFSLPEVDSRLGFDRVARFNYFPGWHQPHTAFHLVVHKPTWDALPSTTREMIELACGNGVYRNLAIAEARQGSVIADFNERGVETRTLSTALLEALEEAVAEVLEEESTADRDFARILEHQRSFRAGYARWRGLAYPRVDPLPAEGPARSKGREASGER
ncbi:MAG: TRAP transporter substrate-binding protein [Phycisphaeraceae bacterium]|nr:C4-dicarboxylate ABC transporter [Deltaproteobacteria bacterium]MCP4066718.1 TRAP transporter substrate-binding protein [Phycisphaeraceae bacterium]